MTEVFPNYYHKFKCIADKCSHSCCVGWEIDIDEATMTFYNSLKGEFGEKIRNNIDGDIPHFILSEDEKCPFLKENGLCEIICQYGEDALCDICFLHPRFRNFYSSFTETGLGLSCEEASRIILSEKEKFSVSLPPKIQLTKEEKEFFIKRKEIFGILQNREKTPKERFSELAKLYGFEFDFSLKKLYELYYPLERFDESWTKILDKLKDYSFDCNIFEDENFEIIFEQLAVYFIFRHLTDAIYDGEYADKVFFSLVSVYTVGAIYSQKIKENGNISSEEIADFARIYSSEIEYSEENTEKIKKSL